MSLQPYRGVFPVVPSIFHDDGSIDLAGQKRAVDFMIDAGSQGLCILANFSEQFVLTDGERETLMDAILTHVAARVPVIVTTTHMGSAACAARSKRAQDAGAAMVMIMPPYHGATVRLPERAFMSSTRPFRMPSNTDHDPGCAGQRHPAFRTIPRPDGEGDR